MGTAGGYSLSPQGALRDLPQSPVLTDVGAAWSPDRFAVARAPIPVGHVEDRARFSSSPTTRVSNVPVKFPGSDYRVPVELECAAEALQLCVDCEHAINPGVDECHAYLTVDRGVVRAGASQRGEEVHADWLQGTRVSSKWIADHGYMCTDRDPPRFFTHPFHFSAEDVAADAYIDVFEEQADPERTLTVEPYDVVLFDAYSVHGAVPAAATAMRTFVRFFYSVSVYDRSGDTRNALFDYDWKMEYRPGAGRRGP